MIHKAPTWHPPQVSDVKAQVVAWLQQAPADAALRNKALAIIGSIGDPASGSELLDRLAETFAVVDPKVAQLVDICSRPRSRLVLPTFAFLTDPKTPPLVAANMRLYYGRWLVHGQWFEEALEQLGGLKTADVVAPAELLFYQGVTYHRMLNKEEGLKVINQLLDGAEATRGATSPSPPDAGRSQLLGSGNARSHRAADGRREAAARPGPGRAQGPQSRGRRGRVARQDDQEDRRRAEQAEPEPAQFVAVHEARRRQHAHGRQCPGNVTKKDIGHKSGWGDMPPKEREEALQHMGRDFPPHFRDAIEEYFRKLATEENSDDEDK